MTWQKLSSVEKYKNRYMTVTEDEVLTDHGDKVVYGIVHKEPFAVAIPWDGSKTVLVGQYRYPIDSFSWEFPMGHYESIHKSVEDAAKVELHEETGIQAQRIVEIGIFTWALVTTLKRVCIPRYRSKNWRPSVGTIRTGDANEVGYA